MGEISVSMDFLMSLIGELYVKLRVQQNECDQLKTTLETYITQLQQVKNAHQKQEETTATVTSLPKEAKRHSRKTN